MLGCICLSASYGEKLQEEILFFSVKTYVKHIMSLKILRVFNIFHIVKCTLKDNVWLV